MCLHVVLAVVGFSPVIRLVPKALSYSVVLVWLLIYQRSFSTHSLSTPLNYVETRN